MTFKKKQFKKDMETITTKLFNYGMIFFLLCVLPFFVAPFIEQSTLFKSTTVCEGVPFGCKDYCNTGVDKLSNCGESSMMLTDAYKFVLTWAFGLGTMIVIGFTAFMIIIIIQEIVGSMKKLRRRWFE